MQHVEATFHAVHLHRPPFRVGHAALELVGVAVQVEKPGFAGHLAQGLSTCEGATRVHVDVVKDAVVVAQTSHLFERLAGRVDEPLGRDLLRDERVELGLAGAVLSVLAVDVGVLC